MQFYKWAVTTVFVYRYNFKLTKDILTLLAKSEGTVNFPRSPTPGTSSIVASASVIADK